MLVHHDVGQYPVGATTFSLPVRPTRRFGSSELNTDSLNGSGPAVTLSEIAFSIYYPTLSNLPDGNKQGIDWLLRPVDGSLMGASHFLDVSYWRLFPLFHLYTSKLQIPVYPSAPLLTPESCDSGSEYGHATWPLVFFFHGLSGTRNSYSHICSRIASSGKVVVIMEHRDGSSIACFPRSAETGLPTPKYYVRPTDTTRGEEGHSEFRMDQLALRRFEIYQTYHTLKELVVNGSQGGLETIDGSGIDWNIWAGKVNFDHVQLVGHSFGGATIFSMLSNPAPERFQPMPISHALLHDPWLEPFPSPGPVPYIKDNNVKIAIINSEQFTLWRAHFARLQQVAKDWNDIPIYTILRSVHEHFSDRYIAEPGNALIGSSSFVARVIRIIGDMTVTFLDDRMYECFHNYPVRKMVFERTKATFFERSKGRLAGEFGEIVDHGILPPPPRNRVMWARL